MRRIIQLIILTSISAGAAEIIALGGGNHQAWVDDSTIILDGISWHSGALISEGITFRRTNLTIAAETGLIYQYEKYHDVLNFQDEFGEVYDSADAYWKYDNLIVPLHLKGSMDFASRINVGLGSGISVVRPLTGKSWMQQEKEEPLYEWELERDQMDTYLAFQIKGEAGIKIIPRLWIKAAVTGQYKVADLSAEVFVNKRAYFASLGLAFRL
ncbi:hypothetical protein GF359_00810 [candidate division WOR-3 bacterium]|uniref:Outer membrane protein beta-barrel domain-containing protein n=1 Tax=candidate division WOR-3 bacterium TaxID=2052148 RepID=A0A9D5QBQ8_UNCW3|nr:hypothetical protein [candidate division WOR-3 bacterium]MBD3363734.1 hypothetical protein [candidate division WOR-3 bacterium]